MEQKKEIAVASQTRYLQNISNPISDVFKLDVLKMDMNKWMQLILTKSRKWKAI